MVKAGRGSEQVMVRLPDGMRDSIRDAAEQSGRSMNAEIVARLEQSFHNGIELGNVFSSRELAVWAVIKAQEFQQGGMAVRRKEGTVSDDWLNDPEALLQASYSVILSLIRDLVRLPDTNPEMVEMMVEQAAAQVDEELASKKRTELPTAPSNKKPTGSSDKER